MDSQVGDCSWFVEPFVYLRQGKVGHLQAMDYKEVNLVLIAQNQKEGGHCFSE